jgi:hypothetical protein
MRVVTVTHRAFFSCDVRPKALLGMFRMAHLSENLHQASLAVHPVVARARDVRPACKGFNLRRTVLRLRSFAERHRYSTSSHTSQVLGTRQGYEG